MGMVPIQPIADIFTSLHLLASAEDSMTNEPLTETLSDNVVPITDRKSDNSEYYFTGEDIEVTTTENVSNGTSLTENNDHSLKLNLDGETLTAVKEPGTYITPIDGSGCKGVSYIRFNETIPEPRSIVQISYAAAEIKLS